MVVRGIPLGLSRDLKNERTVVDDIRCGSAVLDRRGVHDRLDRRSGLAQRLNRAIKLRIVEVASSDHHPHGAVARIEREERALEVRRRPAAFIAFAMGKVVLESLVRVRPEPARFDRACLPLESALCCALLVEIECGVDLETLLVQLLSELRVELLPHPFYE